MSGPVRTVDLTHAWRVGMPVVAGDPSYQLSPVTTVAEHGYAVGRLVAGTHTGTHLDAPAHIFADGQTVDQLDLGRLSGRARVFQLESRPRQLITADLVGQQLMDFLSQPEPEPIVLFATGWDRYFATDQRDYAQHPHLSPALATLLRDQGVQLLGIDTFSPDAADSVELPVHHILLGAGIPIIENLKGLRDLPSSVQFASYPLPLAGADAAPVRAVATVGVPDDTATAVRAVNGMEYDAY